ncbi:MAG: glycine cleavage system protein H, partial [Thermotogae bacterium]|nr:glycine cleavage system protein H [Thermotogota bacterium]
PELVNEDPEGKGWIARIKFEDESELEDTMDENEYREFCEKEEG